MRRKVLQDLANVYCQMFVGWRMGDDLSKLINLGNTQITINVLNGVASLQEDIPVQLHIAEEINTWFLKRLTELNIPISDIITASLRIGQRLRIEETKTKKVAHFDFDCESEITTNEKTYNGKLKESHSWHENTKKQITSR